MNQFGIMVGLKKEAAFEGWFCKVDDPNNELMFSVIIGYTTHKETKHAFIQFQDSISHGTSYISYPIEELSWEKDPFILTIGKNQLSEKGLFLDFVMDGIPVRGNLTFGPFSPIKKAWLKPNIMGLFTYLPTQCNHSIVSMNHKVHGTLEIGEKAWQITSAEGYLEKDWGTSFPNQYLWAQANDWENSSVVFSYAVMPILGKVIEGFFLVLHHDGKEYRFSSIEGSKLVKFDVSHDSFHVEIGKKEMSLILRAKQFNASALIAPKDGEMSSQIKESLDGSMELILDIKEKRVLSLSSKRASIDIHFE